MLLQCLFRFRVDLRSTLKLECPISAFPTAIYPFLEDKSISVISEKCKAICMTVRLRKVVSHAKKVNEVKKLFERRSFLKLLPVLTFIRSAAFLPVLINLYFSFCTIDRVLWSVQVKLHYLSRTVHKQGNAALLPLISSR